MNETDKITETEIRQFADTFFKLEAEVKKAIIGQGGVIRYALIAMVCGGNVLLEGLPGLGKTQLVKAISQAGELLFSRIQFTPDLMPSDVTGTDVFIKNETGAGFEFRRGPIFTNLLLADEINRATPKTQSALLEAMQEKTVTAGSTTYALPKPFFVLATQNPLEMEGTYPLPEAQMDRFMFKLEVGFPNKDELAAILNLTTGETQAAPSKAVDAQTLIRMGEIARAVPISSAVTAFTAALVSATHSPEHELVQKYLRYGSSPRGAQALILGGKVLALLDGRFNVSYDDICELACPALRHRLFLNYEAVSERVTQDEIIKSVVEKLRNE